MLIFFNFLDFVTISGKLIIKIFRIRLKMFHTLQMLLALIFET